MNKAEEESLIHTVGRIEEYQKKWRNYTGAACVFTVILWTIFGTFVVSSFSDVKDTIKNQAVIMNDITHIKSDIKDLKNLTFKKVTAFNLPELTKSPKG